MKLKFTIPLMVLLMGFALQMIGQRVITGTITSAEGDPLIGASVVVKGANTGAISDLDGKYEIKAKDGDMIVFSYIGFNTKEVAVLGQNTIDIVLSEGVQLEEMVITGLGIKRDRKALGYPVDEVKSDVISNSGKTDVIGALQGRVSGITIQSSSGAPGAGSSVIIRGLTSLDPSRSSRPLYVIDGVEVSDDVDIAPAKPAGANFSVGSNNATQGSVSNRIMDINPDDIASMSVLRGAAATALYGVRAANGVIVINTKRGKEGKPSIDVNFGMGINKVNRFPRVQTEFIDGHRYTTKARSFIWDNWGPKKYAETDVPTYNIYEELYRTGNTNNFGASVSAGTDKFTYRLSANRTNSEGVVPFSYYNKTNFNLSAGYEINDKLNIETSFMYANSYGNTPPEGRKSVANVLAYTANVVDMKNYSKPYVLGKNFAVGIIDHALFLAENNRYLSNVNRYIGNAKLKYKITPNISANYVIGFDNYDDGRERIIHPETDEGQSGVNSAPYGFTAVSSIGKTSITSNLFLSWNKDLNNSISLSGNIGQYAYGYDRKRVSVIGKGFQLKEFFNLNNAIDLEQSNSFLKYRNLAAYADLTVGYNNYLYLTLTGRNDWTSTLPKENRSYFFPSANLSWIVSDMVDLPELFSYVKLRGSYSIVGKDASPYKVGTYYNAAFGVPFNEIVGYRTSTYIGDENLKPEFTTSKEIGLELKMFDNRFGLDVSYFNNYIEDMILPVPLSNATGASRFVTNAGAMSTKGLEISSYLDVLRSKDGFNWSVGVNWSNNKGTVEEINTGVDEIAIMDLRGVQYKYVLGGNIGDLYGYKFKRTDEGQLIVNSIGIPEVNWDTAVYMGNALPDFIAGLTNDFSYKGFGLSFLWEWKKGGKVIDIAKNYSIGNGQLDETSNRYEQVLFNGVKEDENGNYVTNDIPVELTARNFYRNWRAYRSAPEVYLQDASWIRLRNLSIYYKIPKSFLKGSFFKGIKLTMTGNNLFLNTPYRGWDPESNYFGPNSNIFGYAGMRTPSVKSYNFKVNFTF